MYEINKAEKFLVSGGAVNWGIVSIIGGAITFIIGLFDGIYNPTACKR